MAPTQSTPPPLVIGIDIGGTNMQFGVVDAADRILGRAAGRSEAERGLDHVLDNIVSGAHRACEAGDVEWSKVDAVGVAVAGAIDIPNGHILIAPNLGWRDVPLRDLLAERLGLPVVIENDVNGAVWGEYHLGAGTGTGDALGVWVGTGIGGGLVLNGALHHGAFFTAGEIGNTVLQPDGPDGQRTVEDLCSRTGLRRIVARALDAHPDSLLAQLANGDVNRLGTPEFARAYQEDDALTVTLIDRSATLLGIAIANWITVLSLDTVFLGGGMTEELGERYVERVRAGFREDVFPDRCRECQILVTTLRADAGLLGAALRARAGSTGG